MVTIPSLMLQILIRCVKICTTLFGFTSYHGALSVVKLNLAIQFLDSSNTQSFGSLLNNLRFAEKKASEKSLAKTNDFSPLLGIELIAYLIDRYMPQPSPMCLFFLTIQTFKIPPLRSE
eukprot:UN05986